MADRDPRYDILFEPVTIGPVTAPNRFYQTPHATGFGYGRPNASIALRALKAEGGWGVVCTEYCSIHSSSDDTPFAFLSLWDDADERALALTADAIHAHGSLAGIELWHGGAHAGNRLSREPMLAPSARSAHYVHPGQVRAMDKADIAELRSWQRQAAIRARRAGFDIIYVYAGHDYLPFQFLSPLTNHRGDEYGGSLENRARLLREMIEDTKNAVCDTCAVAVRLAVDELQGPDGITHAGDGRAVIELLADLPDLWDVNVAGDLGNDSRSSRFSGEGFQEEYVAFVKQVTGKPVVSVGRFTSPDTMVGQIRRGIQDLIGAARPSIADPFLPRKIAEGRADEIRECIGCNICRAANNEAAPIRCTQNPTMGEEWRRGWHPERIPKKASHARALVVGAGPAGLEATLSLARRGYEVTLAEAGRELGGRLINEAALPGLSNWMRVVDHRVHMLSKHGNAEIYRESPLTAAEILEFGAEHVLLATGSTWRRDGRGHFGEQPIVIESSAAIVTPDDIFSGRSISGPVTIYDDEHYFMAGALAERLANDGHDICFITPHCKASAWTELTDEQAFVQARLLKLGVRFIFDRRLAAVHQTGLELSCMYTGTTETRAYENLVLVTGREPRNTLADELATVKQDWADAGVKSVRSIGDCLVPGSIADAVHDAHKVARQLEAPADDEPTFRRERPEAEPYREVV